MCVCLCIYKFNHGIHDLNTISAQLRWMLVVEVPQPPRDAPAPGGRRPPNWLCFEMTEAFVETAETYLKFHKTSHNVCRFDMQVYIYIYTYMYIHSWINAFQLGHGFWIHKTTSGNSSTGNSAERPSTGRRQLRPAGHEEAGRSSKSPSKKTFPSHWGTGNIYYIIIIITVIVIVTVVIVIVIIILIFTFIIIIQFPVNRR